MSGWTNCPRCNKVLPHGAVRVDCPGRVGELPANAASVAPAMERCRLIEKD
jgi:hypothetical protein